MKGLPRRLLPRLSFDVSCDLEVKISFSLSILLIVENKMSPLSFHSRRYHDTFGPISGNMGQKAPFIFGKDL